MIVSLIEELLNKGGIENIKYLCATDQRFYEVCKDEELWKRVYKKILPSKFDYTNKKIESGSLTWRQAIDIEYECNTRESYIRSVIEKVIKKYTNDFNFSKVRKTLSGYSTNDPISYLEFQLKYSKDIYENIRNTLDRLIEKHIISNNSHISPIRNKNDEIEKTILNIKIYPTPC